MADPTPLEEFPKVRKWTYRIFWLVGVIIGSVNAGYAVADAEAPAWVKVALGVYAYLAIALGFMADRNTLVNRQTGASPRGDA